MLNPRHSWGLSASGSERLGNHSIERCASRLRSSSEVICFRVAVGFGTDSITLLNIEYLLKKLPFKIAYRAGEMAQWVKCLPEVWEPGLESLSNLPTQIGGHGREPQQPHRSCKKMRGDGASRSFGDSWSGIQSSKQTNKTKQKSSSDTHLPPPRSVECTACMHMDTHSIHAHTRSSLSSVFQNLDS